MPDKQRPLARFIESIVGAAYVTQEPSLEIDGLSSKLLIRPGSADEVAACLRVCSDNDAAIVPAGVMTWLESGNPLKRCDVILSLERMRAIVDYSPPDLTATVQAGLTLSEFTELTAKQRQWLPLDPPGFKNASLGAVASCNSSGSLRLGFGTPRDYVIGLKLAHVDGSQSKSGGRVVKNVAGYDMNKLYVGSHGTLAILTELTFKLRPLPDCSSTVMVTSRHRQTLFGLAREILGPQFQAASIVFTSRICASLATNWPDEMLLIRFIDSRAAVEAQLNDVIKLTGDGYKTTVLSEAEADMVWAAVADFDNYEIHVRLSVPRSSVPAEFEKSFLGGLECVASADIGAGIIRMGFDADERTGIDQIKRLRSRGAAHGVAVVVEKASIEVRRAVDSWGEVGSTAELMRSIKARFDPQSILNPGKFVLGL
jgi:glycolate oxidase FAD binding subunit